MPVPIPAHSAMNSEGTKPSTRAMPAKAAARIRSATIMAVRREKRSATAPKIGPSSIAGKHVRQQDEPDRPWRAKALVGHEQQGYVGGTGPDRGLSEREEVPARATLVP